MTFMTIMFHRVSTFTFTPARSPLGAGDAPEVLTI